MERVFSISGQLGTDVRTRANAERIWDFVERTEDPVCLDFSGVVFVSRSFADEICNILDRCKNVKLKNTAGTTKTMIDTVSESRKHKRIREKDDSEVLDLKDMESLSSFLSTI